MPKIVLLRITFLLLIGLIVSGFTCLFDLTTPRISIAEASGNQTPGSPDISAMVVEPSWEWGDQNQQFMVVGDSDPILTGNPEFTPQISSGYYHTLAIRSDGAVWAWGRNDSGALGDGTTDGTYTIYGDLRTEPQPVKGLEGEGYLKEVKNISAGARFSLALKQDGTVWAWGNNGDGQLGDGTYDRRTTPVKVRHPEGGQLDNIKQISAGGSHSLALDKDGYVWAWGSNSSYRLGDGTREDRNIPVRVKSPDGEAKLSNVKQVVAASSHSMALKEDGTVWAWGDGNFGRLGDSSGTGWYRRELPVQVRCSEGEGYLENVVSIDADSAHSIAVKENGTVWTWGYNSHGQLGDGSTDNSGLPVQVMGPGVELHLTDVIAVNAAYNHSIAQKQDGTIWAWGYNRYGQLGDGSGGSTSDRESSPVQVSEISSPGLISSAHNNSFILKDDGSLWAWGQNRYAQHGDGTTDRKLSPEKLPINLADEHVPKLKPEIASVEPGSPEVKTYRQPFAIYGENFVEGDSASTIILTSANGVDYQIPRDENPGIVVNEDKIEVNAGFYVAGTWQLQVINPGEGGKSDPFEFEVMDNDSKAPVITSVEPEQPEVDSSRQPLKINGENFIVGEAKPEVLFQSPRGEEYVIPREENMHIEVSEKRIEVNVGLYAAGTWAVQIINPDGSESDVYDFYVAEKEEVPSNEVTVSFDLNGGTSEPLPAQTVEKGEWIVRPPDPRKVGHNFTGWYSTRDSEEGYPFFNLYNLFTGWPVYNNMTLYARWDKQILPSSDDHYAFRNWTSHFFEEDEKKYIPSEDEKVYTYKMSDETYSILIEGLDRASGIWHAHKSRLARSRFDLSWGGACFGMGVSIALIKDQHLDVDFFQHQEEQIGNMDYPKDNETIRSLVHYYQLSQYMPFFQQEMAQYYGKAPESIHEELVDAVKDNRWTLLGVGRKDPDQSEVLGGHLYIGYWVEEDEEKYIIYLLESNCKENLSKLEISKDYSEATLYGRGSYDGLNTEDGTMRIRHVIDISVFEDINLQDEILARGEDAAYDLFVSADQEDYVKLTTNYHNFTISDDRGNQAEVKGNIIEGDEAIIHLGGSQVPHEFDYDYVENTYYLDSSIDAYTVKPGCEQETYDTSIHYSTTDGLYSYVISEEKAEKTFSVAEGVRVEADKEGNIITSVASDISILPWYTVKAEADISTINVKPGEEKTRVYSDQALGAVDLKVLNDYNQFTLSVDTEEEALTINNVGQEDMELLSLLNEDNGIGKDNLALLDEAENILDNTPVTYSVNFRTYGGSPVEKLDSIEYQSTIEEPAEPDYPGFIFEGWYKDAEHTEQWDFASDQVTEDTILYAGWERDEHYTHTVRFTAEGFDDVIITVLDGKSIVDVPAVPEKEGYSGEWDTSDFYNIREDMFVEAIYERDELFNRLAGSDRYETAVEVSRALYAEDGSAEAVVLARGDAFADALAGVPLAHVKNAPLLLTDTDELTGSTAEEIEQAMGNTGTVYILGGNAAVSKNVETTLQDKGYLVERLAGGNRYETAVEIAGELTGNPEEVFLATGEGFADAVAASSAAAIKGAPILLTGADELSEPAAGYLADHQALLNDIYVLGGTAVISNAVYGEARATARISGTDRWETATEVAEEFFTGPTEITLATGDDYPDALSGGVYAARKQAPVILTGTDNLPGAAANYFRAEKESVGEVSVFGGEAAVEERVLDELTGIIE